MNQKSKLLATLKVDVDPDTLKQVVAEGRLVEFINAFSTLAAGQIKGQLVELLAKREDISFEIPYVIEEDDEFGTGPKPMPFIDTVPLPESEWGLRRIVREELKRTGKL